MKRQGGRSQRNRESRTPELRLLFDSEITNVWNGHCEYLRRFFWRYYDENGRRFLWRRKHTSAFALLVAETLLKQTKATDVLPVWSSLLDIYPTPASLARARQMTLLRMLQPLGLQHQRSVALVSMAKAIVAEFSGRVPRKIDDLLDLPYVGLYSACALASFRYRIRVPIVDSNILRIFSRLTGDNFGKDLRRNHAVWALAWAVLPRKRFAEHNYGLLDFSALVCTTQNPGCTRCPLRPRCVYGQAEVALGSCR